MLEYNFEKSIGSMEIEWTEIPEYHLFNIQEISNFYSLLVDRKKPYEEVFSFGIKLPFEHSAFKYKLIEENVKFEIHLLCDQLKSGIRMRIMGNIDNRGYFFYDKTKLNPNKKDEWLNSCASITFNTTKDGAFKWGNEELTTSNENDLTEKEIDDMWNYLRGHSTMLFLALQMLNCKNVDYRRVKYSSKKKKPKEYGGKSYRNNYVINIPNFYKPQGGETQGLYSQRLHSCRGHFKKCEKLFGKISGVFWWNPQMRGNKKLGEIKKTYNVEPIKTRESD